MSLLSRLTAAVAGALPQTRTDAQPASPVAAGPVSRLDGLINLLSGIGTTQDKGRAGRWMLSRRLTEYELDTMLVDSWLARRIVEELPYDCTRLGWDCDIAGDGEAGDPFRQAFDDLGIAQLMQEAMAAARHKGGAGIVLGLEDGLETWEPLDLSRLRNIQWMRVADAYELTTSAWQTDPTLPGYALPREYQYTPADGVGQSLRVHASRVITFQGAARAKRFRQELPGWGESVLQQAHIAIERFEAAEGGIGHLLAEYEVGVLTVAGLQNAQTMGGSGSGGKLNERVSLLNMHKAITRLLVLGDGEKYERSTAAMSGIADARDRLAATVAGAAHMPMTRLFGQAPSGLSTDDKSGVGNWDDYVAAHQRQHLQPAILRMCELVAAAGMVDVPEDASVGVTFRPLRTPSEDEQASTRLKQAQADKLHWEMGVLDEMELREFSYARGYSNRRGLLDAAARRQLANETADIGTSGTAAAPAV